MKLRFTIRWMKMVKIYFQGRYLEFNSQNSKCPRLYASSNLPTSCKRSFFRKYHRIQDTS